MEVRLPEAGSIKGLEAGEIVTIIWADKETGEREGIGDIKMARTRERGQPRLFRTTERGVPGKAGHPASVPGAPRTDPARRPRQ